MIDIQSILQEKYEAECSIDPKKGSLFCTLPSDRLENALDFLDSQYCEYTIFPDKEITFLEIWRREIYYEIVFIPDEELENDN